MEEETSIASSPKPGKRERRSVRQSAVATEPCVIAADQSGDWLPAEELKLQLLEALKECDTVQISLGTLTYLETSSLQVLLAIADSIQQGRVQLQPVTEELKQVMRAAGAGCLLSERVKLHDDRNVEL